MRTLKLLYGDNRGDRWGVPRWERTDEGKEEMGSRRRTSLVNSFEVPREKALQGKSPHA